MHHTLKPYKILILLIIFYFIAPANLVFAIGQELSGQGVLVHTQVEYSDELPREWQDHFGPQMSALMVEMALQNSQVNQAIQVIQALNQKEGASTVTVQGKNNHASMIELGPDEEKQAKDKKQGSHPRERRFGVDFVMGFPTGLGVSFRYTPIAPITLEVGIDSNLIAFSFSGEVTINILPIFMDAKWTPFVSVGYRHIRFTPLIDDAIGSLSVQDRLNQQNVQTELTLDGSSLHAMSFLGGLDYVGESGFHFQVSFGRLVQIGSSHLGGHDYFDSVEIRNAQSYLGFIKFGKQF